MFAVVCRSRRRLRVPPKVSILISPQFWAPQNAVFIKTFSSKQSAEDPQQCFTISYLINSCGLSPKDALSVSKKVTIKSPESPDSVLELLRKYGFTNANIENLITRLPDVLLSRSKKTLLPKLEFFRSIGVPLDALAKNLSSFPVILHRSLENYLIPLCNFLKTFFQSDQKVVKTFKRAPRLFAHGWQREISSKVAILGERGFPESFIVSLMAYQPQFLVTGTKRLAWCIDRAAGMGFDRSKLVFIHAIQVFADMSESTLKHKMEVYRKCGWSDFDISLAFSKHPLCMKLSEKKIMDNMGFLVNDLGLQPVSVARLPVLLCFSLDRRMKPRSLVARILKEKGLLKNRIRVSTFFMMSEGVFLKRYIINYQEDVPQLLDIYRGKLSVSEMGFCQEMILK